MDGSPMYGDGFKHEFEPEFDEPQIMEDGQKAIFLGTMLLGMCLSWDPDASIDEDEDGNLVTAVRVDPEMFEIAQHAFMRENAKAVDDDNTELFVGYAFDDEGNMFIRWDLANPLGVAGVSAKFGKESEAGERQADENGAD